LEQRLDIPNSGYLLHAGSRSSWRSISPRAPTCEPLGHQPKILELAMRAGECRRITACVHGDQVRLRGGHEHSDDVPQQTTLKLLAWPPGPGSETSPTSCSKARATVCFSDSDPTLSDAFTLKEKPSFCPEPENPSSEEGFSSHGETLWSVRMCTHE
jgi:hypothetical protein